MNEPITSTILSKMVIQYVWAVMGALLHVLVAYRRNELKGFADRCALFLISGICALTMQEVVRVTSGQDSVYINLAGLFGGYLSLEAISMTVNYLKEKINK